MQIYYNIELEGGVEIGEKITLSPTASHHLIVVLRHTVGQIVMVCNGRGWLYECKILEASKKAAIVEIISHDPNFERLQKVPEIHVGIAILKNTERMEWAVEKMVEIGVRKITPIVAQRSMRKTVNTQRLLKIVQSAAQQSLKAHLPQIAEPLSLQHFVEQNPGGFIAHCEESAAKVEIPAQSPKYTVLIGPEGDYTPKEIALALGQNYTEITLGDARLRAETAAVCTAYNCVMINH